MAAPPLVSRSPAAPTIETTWIGASVGALSAFDVGQAVGLKLDYGLLRTPPGWRKLDLEWHLVVGASMPSGQTQLTASVMPPIGPGPVQVNAGQEKFSAYLFEVVPTARALFAVTQGLAFFADAGLGLCQTFESFDRSEMYLGKSSHKEYATGVVLHLGLGLAADVAPQWRLVFDPLALDLLLGPKFSGWTPSLGVAYRFQGPGR
jgi:hypothetical protein